MDSKVREITKYERLGKSERVIWALLGGSLVKAERDIADWLQRLRETLDLTDLFDPVYLSTRADSRIEEFCNLYYEMQARSHTHQLSPLLLLVPCRVKQTPPLCQC